MPYCMNCTAHVNREGETCSKKCYAEWYAGMLSISIEGLTATDERPIPLTEQPWYDREVNGYEFPTD